MYPVDLEYQLCVLDVGHEDDNMVDSPLATGRSSLPPAVLVPCSRQITVAHSGNSEASHKAQTSLMNWFIAAVKPAQGGPLTGVTTCGFPSVFMQQVTKCGELDLDRLSRILKDHGSIPQRSSVDFLVAVVSSFMYSTIYFNSTSYYRVPTVEWDEKMIMNGE
jgi:hypothetical protein